MSSKNEILKCAKTGLTLEILSESKCCDISCCGEPLAVMQEKTKDAGMEKHLPVLKKGAAGVRIEVGSIPHPMEDKHFIEWIEVINGDYVNRKYLKPGQKPEAEFYVPEKPGLVVRAYCNIHGLWRS